MKKYYVIQTSHGWITEPHIHTLEWGISSLKYTSEHYSSPPLKTFSLENMAVMFMKENSLDGIIHKYYCNE